MLRGFLPFAIACSFLIHAASCGGQTSQEGDAGAAATSSGSSGSSGDSGGTSSSSGGSSSSSSSSSGGASSGVTVDASLPFDGGPCPNVTLTQSYDPQTGASYVAGRWAACAGVGNLRAFGNNPANVVGLEFGSATPTGGGCAAMNGACLGGDLYLLVQGATGLERGQGPAYHIYYAFSDIFLWLFETPTSGSWSTAISASTSPRVLDIQSTGYNGGTTLIGL